MQLEARGGVAVQRGGARELDCPCRRGWRKGSARILSKSVWCMLRLISQPDSLSLSLHE